MHFKVDLTGREAYLDHKVQENLSTAHASSEIKNKQQQQQETRFLFFINSYKVTQFVIYDPNIKYLSFTLNKNI